MKKLKALVAVLAASISVSSIADQESNLHVSRIFTQGATTGGFYPVENIVAECVWGLMYIDLSTAGGRAELALLMQAKAQNLVLVRVDYTKSSDGTCTATGIHIQ